MTDKNVFESAGGGRPDHARKVCGTAAGADGIDFSRQLREARETRGLSLDECAQALRLPVRVLRQLESGDYTGIDYQVYLRGYLFKYGRYLHVADTDIHAELQRLTPRQPTLVSTGGISRSRYLLERYAQAATYIVLTVVILVPVVWFGVRSGLQKGANLMPLDSAPVAMYDAGADGGSGTRAGPTSTSDTQDDMEPKPLLASIAPFAAMRADAAANVPTPKSPTDQTPAASGNGLSIHLDAPSWVQVTSGQGKRLEYALLPAGTQKTYDTADAHSLNVRIGNADAATVTVAGKKVDLAPYQHANVAHFAVNVRNGATTQAED